MGYVFLIVARWLQQALVLHFCTSKPSGKKCLLYSKNSQLKFHRDLMILRSPLPILEPTTLCPGECNELARPEPHVILRCALQKPLRLRLMSGARGWERVDSPNTNLGFPWNFGERILHDTRKSNFYKGNV
jgi:hypothetical protein